eukprot:5340293-Prymnesium_polylepis.1
MPLLSLTEERVVQLGRQVRGQRVRAGGGLRAGQGKGLPWRSGRVRYTPAAEPASRTRHPAPARRAAGGEEAERDPRAERIERGVAVAEGVG